MRGLAVRLGHDADVWGLAGLAHDLDAEETAGDAARHGARAAERLTELGLPDELVHAVAAHNPATGVVAERPDRRRPDRRRPDDRPDHRGHPRAARPLAAHVKLSSVRKRMREGAFARGVDRASITRCAELGLELDEFLAIALAAMQAVAAELGLAGE